MNLPFGIDFVVRLLSLAKDTDSIICFTPTARTRSITFGLLETTSVTSLAHSFSNAAIRSFSWRCHSLSTHNVETAGQPMFVDNKYTSTQLKQDVKQ